jgi:beta-carotene 3-hydroxylase
VALHSDHHDPDSRWERNDVIPLGFAGLAMVAFALSVNDPRLWWLFWIAVGVTVFGLTYALIHDIYIHRRIPLLPRRIPWLEPLRRAHLEHHRTGKAPYGVIVPIRRAVRRS